MNYLGNGNIREKLENHIQRAKDTFFYDQLYKGNDISDFEMGKREGYLGALHDALQIIDMHNKSE
jgi:hypothetical protein